MAATGYLALGGADLVSQLIGLATGRSRSPYGRVTPPPIDSSEPYAVELYVTKSQNLETLGTVSDCTHIFAGLGRNSVTRPQRLALRLAKVRAGWAEFILPKNPQHSPAPDVLGDHTDLTEPASLHKTAVIHGRSISGPYGLGVAADFIRKRPGATPPTRGSIDPPR